MSASCISIYLVVNVFAVESYVNSECGGVVVRLEQRLLVGFVPHHKVQGIGALMREDMLVTHQRGLTAVTSSDSNKILRQNLKNAVS